MTSQKNTEWIAGTTVRRVADGFHFLECPRWRDGRVWMSDFYAHQVLMVDPASGKVETIAEVPEQPGGLGWLPDGRLLVVSMKDRRLLRREPDGSLVEHADLSTLSDTNLNDLVVDSAGRAYISNFGFDVMSGAPWSHGVIIRVDPDGAAQVVAENLATPNGMALLDGDRTLVAAEAFGDRLTAFTVGSDGALTDQRVWASFAPKPTGLHLADGTSLPDALAALSSMPDGIAAGPDRTIWMADPINHRAVRVADGGEILEEISTGEHQVYSCALGGADGHTLFLTCSPGFDEHERSKTRDSVLLAATV